MFVALVPSEEAVEDLDRFLDVRRSAGDFRWAASDQLHLTLAFTEDLPEHALDEVTARLETAAAKRRAFTTRIAGGGAFPHAAGARVLWAGLDLQRHHAEELDRLAVGCRAAVATAGAPVDGQRFRPHLTVARMRRPVEVSNWVRLLDAYTGPTWSVTEVALVASYLGEGPRNRPRHEVLSTFVLGAGSLG